MCNRQWKKGDLTIVSDESDSGGTITDSTLRHTVQFMEELERAEQLKEKSCGEDLGSSNCQEELHHRDKEQPRVVAEDSNNANNQCQEDYSEQDERRGTDQVGKVILLDAQMAVSFARAPSCDS